MKVIRTGEDQGGIWNGASLICNLFSRSMRSTETEYGAVSVQFFDESSDVREIFLVSPRWETGGPDNSIKFCDQLVTIRYILRSIIRDTIHAYLVELSSEPQDT